MARGRSGGRGEGSRGFDRNRGGSDRGHTPGHGRGRSSDHNSRGSDSFRGGRGTPHSLHHSHLGKRKRSNAAHQRRGEVDPQRSVANKKTATGAGARADIIRNLDPSEAPHLLSAPRSLRVMDFAQARAREISAMLRATGSHTGWRRAYQTLPRHLRRRAMSHHPYRLPKRLRAVARRETSNDAKPLPKKPNRRHIRSSSSFAKKKQLGQRAEKDGSQWLETHIWHAKRFHMLNIWGYRLALTPCDKGVRACYRATKSYATVHDASYYSTLLLCGNLTYLKVCLNSLVCPNESAIFNQMYLNGCREGKTVLYEPGQYPLGAVAPIYFLWRPATDVTSLHRQLMISIHSAAIDSIKLLLNAAVLATKEALKLMLDASNSDDLTLSEMTPSCRRLELRGPEAHILLQKVIKLHLPPSEITSSCNNNENNIGTFDPLHHPYYSNRSGHDVWEKLFLLRSPQSLPQGTVLSLTVEDPRAYRPSDLRPKRDRQLGDGGRIGQSARVDKGKHRFETHSNEVAMLLRTWPTNACASPLWDPKYRVCVGPRKASVSDSSAGHTSGNATESGNEVVVGMMEPESSILQRRACSMLPGDLVKRSLPPPNIPRPSLLLISRGAESASVGHSVGVKVGSDVTSSFGGGWDVIVPEGWSPAFFNAFLYAGCRPIGIKERHRVMTEQGVASFPHDWPDTPAGAVHAHDTALSIIRSYLKKPRSKKVNYFKLKIICPFKPDWSAVTQSTAKFWVARGPFAMESLDLLKSHRNNNISPLVDPALQLMQNALIHVNFRVIGKGTVHYNANICAPTSNDIDGLKNGNANNNVIETIRRKKKKTKFINNEASLLQSDNSKQPINTQRLTIGYVTSGVYSLLRGCSAGIGLISYKHLQSLRNQPEWNGDVWIRNTSGVKYRRASIALLF